MRSAAAIFRNNRNIADIVDDCAFDALAVLHDGLTNPDDKLRLQSAQAILTAHCKLQAAKAQQPAQLPYEERIEALRVALQAPAPELAEALRQAGYEQQVAEEVKVDSTEQV